MVSARILNWDKIVSLCRKLNGERFSILLIMSYWYKIISVNTQIVIMSLGLYLLDKKIGLNFSFSTSSLSKKRNSFSNGIISMADHGQNLALFSSFIFEDLCELGSSQSSNGATK